MNHKTACFIPTNSLYHQKPFLISNKLIEKQNYGKNLYKEIPHLSKAKIALG